MKRLVIITVLSLTACILHALMLQTPFNDYLYTSAFKIAAFIFFPFIYFHVFHEGKLKDLFSMFSVKDIKSPKIPVFLGLGVFIFIMIGFIILNPLTDPLMVNNALYDIGITAGNAVFAAVYIVVINAALEQFFFRGFVFISLYRMNFKLYAHTYSSVLFALYHVPVLFNALTPLMLILSTAGLVAAGLIFNLLVIKTNSLSGALIVHISANLSLSIMIGIFFLDMFAIISLI